MKEMIRGDTPRGLHLPLLLPFWFSLRPEIAKKKASEKKESAHLEAVSGLNLKNKATKEMNGKERFTLESTF